MMTDPIADMLTRIRNAVRVERPHVTMPISKVKRGLAEVLKREGYIWDWREEESQPVHQLRLELKYGPNGERVIRHIKRVSKPGRRVYSAPRSCARSSMDWEFRSSAPAAASSATAKPDRKNWGARCSASCGNETAGGRPVAPVNG